MASYPATPAKNAHYHCDCGKEWWWYPGPIHGEEKNVCPRCGSLYFKWTNYSESGNQRIGLPRPTENNAIRLRADNGP